MNKILNAFILCGRQTMSFSSYAQCDATFHSKKKRETNILNGSKPTLSYGSRSILEDALHLSPLYYSNNTLV